MGLLIYFRPSLRDEPRGRALNVALQTLKKFLFTQSRRNRVEDLGNDRARNP